MATKIDWKKLGPDQLKLSPSLSRAMHKNFLTLGDIARIGKFGLPYVPNFGPKIVEEAFRLVASHGGKDLSQVAPKVEVGTVTAELKFEPTSEEIKSTAADVELPGDHLLIPMDPGEEVVTVGDRKYRSIPTSPDVPSDPQAAWPADAIFYKGDLVRSKFGMSWRGRIVGAYELGGYVGFVVESAFEPGAAIMFAQHKLEEWKP